MEAALPPAVIAERRGSALREVIPSTMGEPLLFSGLDPLVDACADAGVRLNLTTNGTFPGRGARAWAERLVPVASDVKISWNGAAARTAEAVMPGLSFEEAQENVRVLAAVRDAHARAGRTRCRISFQVTVQEANVDELAGIVGLARALGVDRVKLNHLQVRSPALAARSLRRSPEAIRRLNAALASARAAAGPADGRGAVLLENAVELRPDPSDPAPRGPCPFAGREAWIHPDGRFAPCPHPAAARGELGGIGGLAVGRGRTLGEVWESEEFRLFVEGGREGEICEGCAFRRVGGA
jgi:MoaA/NifB/PqqE/SkfB family radical SAM enzyme